ncbi:acetamidase/formamidase family protein [Falsibacillus pallidus]|uniref:acetamidase/formamidase family protein n=1 Tax=Falsibacillus pallidus TaxID=493781 RepID=UPI003D95203B
MALHKIVLKNEHLHASFSKDYEPILTIQSGDSIECMTPDIGWGYNDTQGQRTNFHSRLKEQEWGHPMIGPIYIQEAKPGMALKIQIDQITPAHYGWNCAGGNQSWHSSILGVDQMEETTLDWEIDRDHMTGKTRIGERSFTVDLEPFMGVMAVAPEEPGVHPTIPPDRFGGNIDCKELAEGSTLYLPVFVEGALFSVGDGHAKQGDGEVSGQAIECPMDSVVLKIEAVDMQLNGPLADTPKGWMTFGFHEDLNEATIMALNEMVQFIQQKYEVTKTEAVTLASTAVDLHITQIVNGVKGVHAILPHNAFKVS